MEISCRKPPLSNTPCRETLPCPQSSAKKRQRGPDSSADDCTPSPHKSARKSTPRTPEIGDQSSRFRPRKLGFDAGPPLSSSSSSSSSEKEILKENLEPDAAPKTRETQSNEGEVASSQTPILKPSSIRRASPRLADKTPTQDSVKKQQSVVKALQFAPSTPKRKSLEKKSTPRSPSITNLTPSKRLKKKWLDHVVIDRVKLSVGDDVYVRRTDEEIDEEAEGCLICGKTGKLVECDNCSRGIHLKCNNPPLKKVPEGDWLCPKCEIALNPSAAGDLPQTNGILKDMVVVAPKTARELLLASKLWAARIERLWKNDVDGSLWFRGRWYVIPEETSIGRQPHNLRRELFLGSQVDENEVESILRKCFVMSPNEFRNAGRDGDDVFLCEYEYDNQFETFRRISDMEMDGHTSSDDLEDEVYEAKEDADSEDDALDQGRKKLYSRIQGDSPLKPCTPSKAANSRGGNLKIGAKSIPQNARIKPVTVFERARAALRLTATPEALPCREREMKEISSFVTDAVVAGDKSLGHCLYISGVPGTGKTATVMEVMQKLKRKHEEQSMNPYRFVEINGLRLTSPEHLYTVLYEALTGHHVGWKKALQLLDERFCNPKPSRRADTRPCILFIDELDLLVTRNQSVLYNIFDWPTRPHSRLFVIGIANTIDLPERLLPRIASRMGLQRVSFSPYSHEQLQTVISSRLKAINAFEKQAIEFASRKVAAISGDARRALELCRRAVEVAELRCSNNANKVRGVAVMDNLVGMKDVEEAIKEMFQAPHIKMMGRCSKQAKIFLVSMVYEQHKTGMVETTFEKVASTFSILCRNNSENPTDWDTLLSVGCALGACRLILCEPGSHHRVQKMQLNFPTDDVSFALKEDQEVPWLTKYL